MATVFLFYVPREFITNQYIHRIKLKGDFDFNYKIGKHNNEWILRIYNLQDLNKVLIDLLDNEFSLMEGYSGYIKLTIKILDELQYNEVLGLTSQEQIIVRELCLK